MRPATARPALSLVAAYGSPGLYSPPFLLRRTAKLYRVGDSLHADGRGLPDHRDHVVCDFARIDVDGPHASKARRSVAPALQGLDEYRHRGEPVGEHHLPGGAGLAEAALELDDLVEPRQLGGEPPAGGAGRGGPGILDAPVLPFVAGAHHVAGDVAGGELREHQRLDAMSGGVDGVGAHEHAAPDLRVEAVAVAQIVLGLQHDALALESGDALRLPEADVVVPRQRGNLLREQSREVAVDAPVDLDHAAVGQVEAHPVPGAHDLARHAVRDLELLDVAARVAGDAGSLGAPVFLVDLVDEGAGIREALSRLVHLAQPGHGVRRLRVRHRGRDGERRAERPRRHLRGSWARPDTVSAYGAMPWKLIRGENAWWASR